MDRKTELMNIANELTNANRQQLLLVAKKILNGEINSFVDYQVFVGQ